MMEANGGVRSEQTEHRQLRRDSNFVGSSMIAILLVTELVAALLSLLGAGNWIIRLPEVYQSVIYDLLYVVYIGLPVPLLACLCRRHQHPFALHARVPAGTAISLVTVGMALCLLANLASTFSMGLLGEMFDIPFPDMPQQMTEPSLLNLIVNIVGTAMLPALLEEMVFRGYIMGALLPYGQGLAVTVSAVLFGLLHSHPVQMVFATMVGLIFGWLVVWTRNIWVSVVLHFLNNLLSVIHQYASLTMADTEQSDRFILFSYVVVMMLGIIGLAVLLSTRGRSLRASVQPNSEMKTSRKYAVVLTSAAMVVAIVFLIVRWILPMIG